jgi:replication factor C subunit 3/5
MLGTKQIFTAAPQPGSPNSLATYKLIILDEADAMTSTAQMALRRIMERYTANTRFCVIANYTHKLSPALLSRCTRFRFSPLKEEDIRFLVDKVIEEEQVKISEEAVRSLVTLSKGDMRRALNVLQACHASSMSSPLRCWSPNLLFSLGTPLATRGQPKPDPKTIIRDLITETTVYDCVAAPHPGDIQIILSTLLSTPDVTTCLTSINTLKANKGLALADILTALSEELALLEAPPQTRVAWLEGLAEVEYRLSGGGGETVQTGGLVGVVRHGVELMEKER